MNNITSAVTIYKIVNTITGESYIGSTKKGVEYRFSQHVYNSLVMNHQLPINKNLRTYGVNNFSVEVLAILQDESMRFECERFFIESLHPNLNVSIGMKHSQETKDKISARNVDREDTGYRGLGAHSYIAIHPNGRSETITSLNGFCKKHHLNQGNATSVCKGRLKSVKGFKFSYAIAA